ncbi:hypothetical protein LPB138_07080 [Urechidicola croceus]|uniref:Uncharacterized protein n=2 Tax=Urechidicola croceus TaxID=1850246 RepID=A0A1D8P789_9FLAO|nr:hypothetical protein LPB138_07080 [Urechidicola croceus]
MIMIELNFKIDSDRLLIENEIKKIKLHAYYLYSKSTNKYLKFKEKENNLFNLTLNFKELQVSFNSETDIHFLKIRIYKEEEDTTRTYEEFIKEIPKLDKFGNFIWCKSRIDDNDILTTNELINSEFDYFYKKLLT